MPIEEITYTIGHKHPGRVPFENSDAQIQIKHPLTRDEQNNLYETWTQLRRTGRQMLAEAGADAKHCADLIRGRKIDEPAADPAVDKEDE